MHCYQELVLQSVGETARKACKEQECFDFSVDVSECPDPFQPSGSSCLFIPDVSVKASWNNARSACIDLGGDLAILNTAQKHQDAQDLALTHGPGKIVNNFSQVSLSTVLYTPFVNMMYNTSQVTTLLGLPAICSGGWGDRRFMQFGRSEVGVG